VGTVYDAAGGEAGLCRLAAAWHVRVLADEVVSHAFRTGYRPDHTERLAAYWGEALGGPPTYSERYGDETSVVRIHSGNGRHEEMDQRAVACFDRALVDAGLDADPRLRQVLHDYFAWATTTAMARWPDAADDVPADLAVPGWSWDGPSSTATRRWHPPIAGPPSAVEPAGPPASAPTARRRGWRGPSRRGSTP